MELTPGFCSATPQFGEFRAFMRETTAIRSEYNFKVNEARPAATSS
jgi:hypothetical protein